MQRRNRNELHLARPKAKHLYLTTQAHLLSVFLLLLLSSIPLLNLRQVLSPLFSPLPISVKSQELPSRTTLPSLTWLNSTAKLLNHLSPRILSSPSTLSSDCSARLSMDKLFIPSRDLLVFRLPLPSTRTTLHPLPSPHLPLLRSDSLDLLHRLPMRFARCSLTRSAAHLLLLDPTLPILLRTTRALVDSPSERIHLILTNNRLHLLLSLNVETSSFLRTSLSLRSNTVVARFVLVSK